MRITALILGILGGLAGLAGAVTALFAGGLGAALEAEGADEVIGLGWAAVPIAIVGIVGGGLALSKPKVAAILLLFSGLAGLIAVSAAYVPAAIMLIVGAVFAYLGRKDKTPIAS